VKLQVNGDPMEIPEGTQVANLLKELKLKPELVVVELNLEILKREALNQTMLKEGDQVEIVQIVGGGTDCNSGDTILRAGFKTPRGRAGRSCELRKARGGGVAEGALRRRRATPRNEANPPSPSGCGGRRPSPSSLLLDVLQGVRHRRRSSDLSAWRSQRGSRGVLKPALNSKEIGIVSPLFQEAVLWGVTAGCKERWSHSSSSSKGDGGSWLVFPLKERFVFSSPCRRWQTISG